MKKENPKLTLAIGTKSSQKLEYLKNVLEELAVEAEIQTYNAESGVSDQPMTSQETLKGAENRASFAIKNAPKADFGVGIEVGYDKVNANQYEIFCWTVIIDLGGKIHKAKSHPFLLPRFHNKTLIEGKYLGDYVRDYFNHSSDPVTQYVAEAVRGRKNFITESLRYALIYALHVEHY